MTKIFISYAREDIELAQEIASKLEARKHAVWRDDRIPIGARFDREIERELRSAVLVIVLWTSSALDSEWVANEACFALKQNTLFPVSVDGTTPPLEMLRRQWVRLDRMPPDRYEESLNSLLDSITTAYKRRQTQTYDAPPASDWRYFGGFRVTDQLLSRLPIDRPNGLTRYELARAELSSSSFPADESIKVFRAASCRLFLAFTDNESESQLPDQIDAETALYLAHELVERYAELGRKVRSQPEGASRGQSIPVPNCFNRVYLNTVNSFIKDILELLQNRERSRRLGLRATEAEVAAGIRHIVRVARIERRRMNPTKLSVGAETHAIYTLGRLRPKQPFMAVDGMLAKFQAKLDAQLPEEATLEDDFDRQLRLMRRTVLLSRATLGEREALGRYMSLIQNSLIETDVNAGFHLEYYCDKPRDEQVPLCSSDDGSDCSNTLIHLTTSLARAFESGLSRKNHPLHLVEAYTLASIVARRLHGQYDKVVRKTLPLLERLYKRIDGDDTKLFLELLLNVASSGPEYPEREFGRYLAAKKAPRNGWVECGVRFPETVGAHTSALLWLCRRIPRTEFPALNISRIRRMLEVHDLGEGITSDVVESGPREGVAKTERALMRRLSWLGLYMEPRVDLFGTYTLYKEFAEQSTQESKVAKDLDRLDILLEGWSLQRSNAEFNRPKLSALVQRTEDRIATEEGKFLLQKLRLMNILSEESFRTTPPSPIRDYFFPQLIGGETSSGS